MSYKHVFIDLQGFKLKSNKFIVKEVAIVFNSEEYINFIIKPPFDFNCLSQKEQKEAYWLIKYFHHPNWSTGFISFKNVCNFLKNNLKSSTIYVKGTEKCKWFKKMLHLKVFNIEDLGCINFKELNKKYPENIYCSYHNYGVCALKNAILLERENLL